MYSTILSLHSTLAYAALGVLLLAVINAILGVTSKSLFKPKDRSISLVALIICHVQLVVGLLLYIVSDKFEQWSLLGMRIMKNSELRRKPHESEAFFLPIFLILIFSAPARKVPQRQDLVV